MKIVLDTNVLIAAFIARGACADLFEYVCEHHEVLISRFILDEFTGNLVRKFGMSEASAHTLMKLIEKKFVLVEPACLDSPVCRDEDDDTILGTALAAGCDILITGDKDLLALKQYRGTTIIKPSDFWGLEEAQRGKKQ